MSDDDGYDLPECACTAVSDNAVLIKHSSFGTTWIPKSQLHDNNEVNDLGDQGTLWVSTWLAEKRGWL